MFFHPCVLFCGVTTAPKQPRLKQYRSLFMYEPLATKQVFVPFTAGERMINT